MSLCIVDFLGDFLYHELLPRQPNILILCHEGCLVPDILKSTLLQDSNFQYLSQGGLFIHRVPSDFQRGCAIGIAFNMFPSSKLYTSRRDLFLGFIPSFFIEFLNEAAVPSSTPVLQATKQVSDNKESQDFEEAYDETLQKYVKAILLEKHLRTFKISSLKGQIKALATGILGHLSKKKQISDLNLDKIVEYLVQDLESEGIIKISAGKVEYNDSLCEAFFGFKKSKIFVPAHRKPTIGVAPGIFQNPQNSAFFNIGNKNIPFQGFLPESQNLPYAQFKDNSSAFQQPKYPETNIPNSFISSTTPGPEINNKSIFPPFKSIFKIEPKQASFDWSLYEHNINEMIINEFSKSEVNNCLKLFQICNRTTRDYLTDNSLKPADTEVAERIKKSLKFVLGIFFEIASNKSIDEIVENIKENGFIKLNLKT